MEKDKRMGREIGGRGEVKREKETDGMCGFGVAP